MSEDSKHTAKIAVLEERTSTIQDEIRRVEERLSEFVPLSRYQAVERTFWGCVSLIIGIVFGGIAKLALF